jgi:hypothetical protein
LRPLHANAQSFPWHKASPKTQSRLRLPGGIKVVRHLETQSLNAAVMNPTTPSTTLRERSPSEGVEDHNSLSTENAHTPALKPRTLAGSVLFEVSFCSDMSDADLALLVRTLGLSLHTHPKTSPDPASYGVARLDWGSGLFLKPGPTQDQWVLEARTWSRPQPQTVHEWHLLACGAACQLDPTVEPPKRLPLKVSDTPIRPVGEAANRRLSGLRRRLVGLG